MNHFDTPDSPTETAINAGPYPEPRICAPGNVRGRRISSNTAQLTWDEPYATCNLCPDAIGYEVYGEGIERKSVFRPPCEITGLKAGVEYLFYVTAKAAGINVSKPTPFHLPKMRAPTKPGTPQLSALTHESVSLSWASSSHEGISSYRVYLNGVLVKQESQALVSLTHLQSHTDYRVEVRAVNAAGISEPSFVTFKTRVRPPTNLRFSQRNGRCRLAWDPVFKKHPAHELSINGQVFTTAPGRWGFNFMLADVSPGPVPHHLKFALHARLEGDISDVVLLERTVADDVPPSQPGGPVASDITDYGATLRWEPSSDNVGVTSYDVVLNGFLVFSTPDTHFTFTKLTSGAYHWVFVRARDKDGNASVGSPTAVFKTTGQAPSPRPSPPEASITVLTSTSARLEWQYEDGIPDSGVRILINQEHFRDVLLLNAIVLNDLIPDVEYSISVSTFDLYGQLSEPTILVHEPRDVTPPSTPANLSIVEVTADSATLAWEESTDDIAIHEYVIYNNQEYFDSTPMLHYTAVDLLPGTYSFEVCAMDLSGNASEPASISIDIQGAALSKEPCCNVDREPDDRCVE
jgi:chitodextrinase